MSYDIPAGFRMGMIPGVTVSGAGGRDTSEETSMNKAEVKGRRAFLRSMAAAGGAVAVAGGATVAQTVSGDKAPEAETPAKARGYHLTPHIEAYYRLADF